MLLLLQFFKLVLLLLLGLQLLCYLLLLLQFFKLVLLLLLGLQLLCYLLLLLQFFKLILLLLLGLPSVDKLLHFQWWENHTIAHSHLPHIVSTFISIPLAIVVKAHLHYSSFSSLPKLHYNFSNEEEEEDLKHITSTKLQIPKIVFNNNFQTWKPTSPHSLLLVHHKFVLLEQLHNSCPLPMHPLVPVDAFACVPSTLPSP